jgi:hypothetical protein
MKNLRMIAYACSSVAAVLLPIANLAGCGGAADIGDAGGAHDGNGLEGGQSMEAGRGRPDGGANQEGGTHEGGARDTGSSPDVMGFPEGGLDGELPAACIFAVDSIDWTDAGADCLGAPTGWAAGLAPSWKELFARQCRSTVAGATCTAEATKYFDCLAAEGGSCTPCITPNSGECKGSAGIVYSSCGTLETALAQCACKPSGASCTSDVDCCGSTGLALTCSGNSCAY